MAPIVAIITGTRSTHSGSTSSEANGLAITLLNCGLGSAFRTHVGCLAGLDDRLSVERAVAPLLEAPERAARDTTVLHHLGSALGSAGMRLPGIERILGNGIRENLLDLRLDHRSC